MGTGQNWAGTVGQNQMAEKIENHKANLLIIKLKITTMLNQLNILSKIGLSDIFRSTAHLEEQFASDNNNMLHKTIILKRSAQHQQKFVKNCKTSKINKSGSRPLI